MAAVAVGNDAGAPAHRSTASALSTAPTWSGPLATAALLGSAGLIAVDGLRNSSDATRIAIWSISLVLLSAAALIKAGQREGVGLGFGRMRIGAWFPLWFGFGFGLTSLSWREPTHSLSLVVTQSTVVRALVLLHLALAAWTVGYFVGPGALLTKAGTRLAAGLAPGNTYVLRHNYVPWVLFGVGIAGRTAQLMSGRFGYLGDPSQLLTNPARSGQLIGAMIGCGTLAIVVAAVDYVRKPSVGRRATLLVVLTAQVVLTSLSGHKAQFLVAMMAVAIVFAAKGRFPWRSMLAGLAIFVLLVVPYVTSLRAAVRNSSTTLSAEAGLATAPSALRTSLQQSNKERFSGSLDLLGDRTREIDMIAVVLAATPRVYSYESPISYLKAPVIGLIPRAVWPTKPVLDSGYRFARKYLGTAPGQYTSAAVPPTADLFIHGGVLMVALGMFGIGAVSRLVDRTLHPELDLRYSIIFLALFQTLIKSESDITSMVASLPIQLVVALVVCRYAFRPVKREDSPPRPDGTPDERVPAVRPTASEESHAIATPRAPVHAPAQ